MADQNPIPPAPTRRLLYTKKEACFQLSISLRNLDRRIAEGTVKTRHLGGRVLIPHSELIRLSRGDQPRLGGKRAPEKFKQEIEG
jgi:hypothetical protein